MRKTQNVFGQTGKRALAFVMTLALLLGMLPAGTVSFRFAAKAANPAKTTFSFDFGKLWTGGADNSGTDLTTVDSFEKTTKGSGEEINASNGVTTDPWMYTGKSAGATVGFLSK